MEQFSIREFCISRNLTGQEGDIIAEDNLPNPAWGLGPYAYDEALIYLCTLVKFFHAHGMLDNMLFSFKKMDEDGVFYTLYIDEVERSGYMPDWGIVTDTLEFLIPHMAGSNVSYLAGQLFFDN